jgi:hypothetical protein
MVDRRESLAVSAIFNGCSAWIRTLDDKSGWLSAYPTTIIKCFAGMKYLTELVETPEPGKCPAPAG